MHTLILTLTTKPQYTGMGKKLVQLTSINLKIKCISRCMLSFQDFVSSFVKWKHASELQSVKWRRKMGRYKLWHVRGQEWEVSQKCGNDVQLATPHIYMQRKLGYAKESKRKFSLENCCKACHVSQNFAGNFKHNRQKAIVNHKIQIIDGAPVANEWGGENPRCWKILLTLFILNSQTKSIVRFKRITLRSQRLINDMKLMDLIRRQMTPKSTRIWHILNSNGGCAVSPVSW